MPSTSFSGATANVADRDRCRHGALDDDAADAGIGVEAVDDAGQLLDADDRRVDALLEHDADLVRHPLLVTDVKVGRRPLADRDRNELGRPTLGRQTAHLGGDFGLETGGQDPAIQYLVALRGRDIAQGFSSCLEIAPLVAEDS